MDLENTLAPWLGKTMKMIDNHIQDIFDAENIDLTKTQWVILKMLKTRDGVPQQELAFIAGRDKTSLTRLINTMERKNLVARIPSKKDKRINLVYLTKYGNYMFKKTLPIMKKFASGLQENISEEEIKIAISVIKKVQQNLIQKPA